MYRFQSLDRAYSQWVLVGVDSGEERIVTALEPSLKKWFSGDVMDSNFELVTSPIRAGEANTWCPRTLGGDLRERREGKVVV